MISCINPKGYSDVTFNRSEGHQHLEDYYGGTVYVSKVRWGHAAENEICNEDGYIGDKPNPNHWEDLINNDSDFHEEFERIYNNDEIPEADDEDYIPDILDDTYLNMEVAFPWDGKGLDSARVFKRLQEKYGIPIGTASDKPILESRIYEFEYPYGHQASLADNAIAKKLPA